MVVYKTGIPGEGSRAERGEIRGTPLPWLLLLSRKRMLFNEHVLRAHGGTLP